MPEESRFDIDTIWVQTPAGPEPITVGGPLLLLPLGGAKSGMTRDNSAIEEATREPVKANSVQEVCKKFGVRIEGTIEDLGGETKNVSLPAIDERSFTVDDLTRRERTLRRRYVEMRLCETLAEKLARFSS